MCMGVRSRASALVSPVSSAVLRSAAAEKGRLGVAEIIEAAGDPEVARITVKIETLIKEHFQSAERYYLSRLGVQLGEDRRTLERLTGKKLAQFVREKFDYKIGTSGQHKNVLYLIAPGTSAKGLPVASPRYLPRFWAAFAMPLRDDEERYIDLDTLEFGPKDMVAGDVRPIEAEYVAPNDASGSAAETAMRISRWLDKQQLDGERFHMRLRRSPPSGESLLNQVLSVLDRDQLRRTSLPLDVIKSLTDRRS